MTVTWVNPGGGEQTPEHWEDAGVKSIALRLSRDDLTGEGEWNDVIVAFNAFDGPVPFKLPEREGHVWKAVIDTNAPDGEGFETPGGERRWKWRRGRWWCSLHIPAESLSR